MNGSVAVAADPRAGRGAAAILSLAAIGALVFIGVAAIPYFLRMDEVQFRQYWPMRGWLLTHITMGMVAILTGPVQLWLGLSDRFPALHKNLGFVYMAAVTLGAVAAYYLAFNTSGGAVFGSGLAALATAWLATTGMAFLAIKRHLYEQHKEWMIRSYVVTFAFVFFRIGAVVLGAMNPDGQLQQVSALAWACWALPLLVTELVIQGRKIMAVSI